MKTIMTIFMLLTAPYAFANKEVLIDDKHIVAQLSSIQLSLDTITSQVMTCMSSGVEHSKCLCDNKDIITSFNNQTLLFFKNNPAFKNHDFVRFKFPSGEWVTQSLQGILKQARAGTPSCT